MKLERRHGMLAIAAVGTALAVAVLTRGDVSANDPGFVPTAVRGDWDGIEYPALDRLISERAALARAKEAVNVASR